MRRGWIVFLVIVACLAFQVSCFGADPKDLLNKAAPRITGVDWLSGSQTFPVSNRVNLVVFWNSRYKSSVDALDSMQKLYNTYSARGLVVIGLNDSGEAKSVLSMIEGQKGIKFPLGTGSGATKAAGDYFLKGVPVAFLINKSGNIVHIIEGYTSNFEAELSSRINSLL